MKIKAGILGATGSVGQKFIQLLATHPWFEISALGASERSAGKPYKEAANWFLSQPIPPLVADMTVRECKPGFPAQVIFSGLDAAVAGEIEAAFARAGYPVISNSRNHRFDPDVPLLIPEVNAGHLELIKQQNYAGGFIVTNPNCSTIGLVMGLKPLEDHFGIKRVHVVTLQALSGAGYPGVSSLDIIDNAVPFISGEERKMETEPLKILGKLDQGRILPADFKISAQCNRIAVIDGHLECVSLQLKSPATEQDIIHSWQSYRGAPQALKLPSAPQQPIHYFTQPYLPQPKLQRDLEKGMALSIGRLQHCAALEYKFVLLSHNTVRGAAGAAILNAELMLEKGLIEK